jgi:hypothetical protein
MSSATSTDAVRLPSPELRPGKPDAGLQPWQFFVLAALICATGVTYMVRGQGVATVLLLSVLMLTTAIVGLAVLRTVRPLVTKQEDRTPMVGDRTRAALEREKMLALRTLKELEFDRSMKKISDDDYREMSARLRARATRIMRQLDAGAGYRAKIEADLVKRLGEREAADTKPRAQARTCAACQTINDVDAKFCKNCGQRI